MLISSQPVNFRLLTWQANGHPGAPPPGALAAADEVRGPPAPPWGVYGHLSYAFVRFYFHSVASTFPVVQGGGGGVVLGLFAAVLLC